MRRALASLSMVAIGLSSFAMPAFAGPKPTADLSILKTGETEIGFTESAQYTLSISNAGPSVATNVVVSDKVPANTEFLPEKSSPECELIGATIVCSAASLAVGSTVEFTVSLGVDMPVCKPITIKNKASVKSEVNDPKMNNNTSKEVKTSVICPAPACSDGLDNDNDGAVDYPADFACANAKDNNEGDKLAQCQDAKDNDKDDAVDLEDFSCSTNQDNNEANPKAACQDGKDNDGDGKKDYPKDPDCSSKQDNDESAPAPKQCNDGIDNDNDGATDYPNEFSCSSATDDDEANPKAACQDGIDNDDDGKIDTKEDAGCSGNQDDDEYNAPATEEELVISVKSTGSSDTAVKNQKNITLLRFEGKAANEDILVTSASFNAQTGSIVNGQSYRLWVDTDGNTVVDTVLQAGVNPSGGIVTFDAMIGGGYVIPATQTVVFEVHSDVAASLSNPASLQLQFATSVVDYLQSERVNNGTNLSGIKTNGSCATTCEMTVGTTPSMTWSFVSQGDLFVSQSTTPLRMRQLLGGKLEDAILQLKLRAEMEDVEVTDLRFTSIDSNGSSIDRLDLYLVGATTPFASATIGGCSSDPVPANTFCSNTESQQLVILEGSSTDVIVRPRMKSDVDGGIPGQLIRLRVYPEDTAAAFDGAVVARGLISSNTLTPNDGDGNAEGEVFIGTNSVTSNAQILGQKNVVTMAEYTSMTNANPDANGTSIPTGVSPFGQFKFTAAANANFLNGSNKAVMSGVIFNVNATNVALAHNGFKFYNKADSTSKVGCTAKKANGTVITGTASGSFLVECANLASSIVNTVLDQGTDAVYVLEGNITNPMISSSQSSALQASIQNFTTPSSDIPTAYGATTQHIQWIDRDTNSTTHAWIDYPDTVIKSTSYQN